MEKSFRDFDREKGEKYMYDMLQFSAAADPERITTWDEANEISTFSPQELVDYYPGKHRMAGDYKGHNLIYFREYFENATKYIGNQMSII